MITLIHTGFIEIVTNIFSSHSSTECVCAREEERQGGVHWKRGDKPVSN